MQAGSRLEAWITLMVLLLRQTVYRVSLELHVMWRKAPPTQKGKALGKHQYQAMFATGAVALPHPQAYPDGVGTGARVSQRAR